MRDSKVVCLYLPVVLINQEHTAKICSVVDTPKFFLYNFKRYMLGAKSKQSNPQSEKSIVWQKFLLRFNQIIC